MMQSQQRPGQIPWKFWYQDGPSTSSSLEARKADLYILPTNQSYSGCPRDMIMGKAASLAEGNFHNENPLRATSSSRKSECLSRRGS